MAQANTGVTWLWSGPGNFTSTEQNPGVLFPGTYQAVASSANGCTSTVETMVGADTGAPQLSIQAPAELDCLTPQVSLFASIAGSVPYTYLWSTPNGHFVSGENTLIPLVDQAGTYQLEVTNTANGCSSLELVTVVISDGTPHAADILKKPVSCFGDRNGAASIEGISGGTAPYLFSLDQQPFTTENSFGPDTSIHFGDALLISLDHVVNFPDRIAATFLSPPDLPLDSIFLPEYSLRYQVRVVDSSGCEARDERLILVDRSRRVYVPNIFHPGTAENSMLTVYGGPDVARIQSFQIFDRWGEVVHEALDFEKNDLEKGWDGSFRGHEVMPGVYVYVARVRFMDGKTELFRGDVTVIR